MRRSAVSSPLLAFTLLATPALADERSGEPVLAVLRAHCGGCHGPGGTAKGGFDFVLDRDKLVARGLVVPGEAARSPLLERVRKGEMPPKGKKPVPKDDLAALTRWVEAGAPGGTKRSTFVSDLDLSRTIRHDLESLEPRQRRFVRYLTLAHLANAGASDADLDLHRQAVAKLVNSLSWNPRIVVAPTVDPGRTIYRLDLRDYKWAARSWERLAAEYPYRPEVRGETAKAVAALTGSDRAVLRGDWFVAIASRPPFYHDFLDLPSTDRGLERLLRVDVIANLRDDAAARAGFNGSGVSKNNRVIERHDAAHGAYWRSYDFSDNTGRQNIFEHPLGPGGGEATFRHAGGEAIFHLPNGLLGYLLADANGSRIDKAPGEIVGDPKRPDKLVETGVSCFSCHAAGLLPKEDQVRPRVLKDPEAFKPAHRDAIKALYPPADKLKALVDDDNARYLKALEQAGVPKGEPEPISTVTMRYEGVLDLAAAASEAGMKADVFADRLRKESVLAKSLGALLARGGTVQRQLYEESFPDLARALKLGEEPATAPVPVAFAGHDGPIRAVAVSADGKLALTGGQDRTARLWDLATGKERMKLEGHSDEIVAVALSPDGKQALTAGGDRTLRLWDLASGREARRLAGHSDVVRAVVFLPNGWQALSGGADKTLRLWDLKTGKETRAFSGHTGAVVSVTVSANGKFALSGSQDRTARVWDIAKGREKARLEGHTGTVHAVAFSPNAKLALTGGADKTVRLWDVAKGTEARTFTGHANTVIGAAFAGKFVLSAASRYQTADAIARVWDRDTGKELSAADTESAERVECAAFTSDGRWAILGLGAGTLRLASLSDKR